MWRILKTVHNETNETIGSHTLSRLQVIGNSGLIRERVIIPIIIFLTLFTFFVTSSYFPFSDEIENLYDGFLVSKGLLPYRDYFTNHMPGLHLFLSPLFYSLGKIFSNYALFYICRFVVLVLHGVCLYYFSRQFCILFNVLSNEDKRRLFLMYFFTIFLISYSISPIFMTNLTWSESFLFLYMLVSAYFIIKEINCGLGSRDIFIFGLFSGIIFLFSLSAVSLISCNFCFLFFLILFLRKEHAKTRANIGWARKIGFFFVGAVLPNLPFFFIVKQKIGWDNFYTQCFQINFHIIPQALSSFGFNGVLGYLLKPLDFLIQSSQNIVSLPKRPLILTNNAAHVSFGLMLLLLILPLILLVKENRSPKIIFVMIYFFGTFYSSLTRGTAFHVGFGFHFVFVVCLLGIYVLKEVRELRKLNRLGRGLLVIVLGVCLILVYAFVKLEVGLAAKRENFTIIGTGVFAEQFKIRKLFSYFGDPMGEKYKLWIPMFNPADLYFAHLVPADKVYMLHPAVNYCNYFVDACARVLNRKNVLVLPKGKYGPIPENILRKIEKKVNNQNEYLPKTIYNFEKFREWKEGYTEISKFFEAVMTNWNFGNGIILKAVVNRGYRYSLFFEKMNDKVDSARLKIVLRGSDRTYFEDIGIDAGDWVLERFARVDWEPKFSDGFTPGEYEVKVSHKAGTSKAEVHIGHITFPSLSSILLP